MLHSMGDDHAAFNKSVWRKREAQEDVEGGSQGCHRTCSTLSGSWPPTTAPIKQIMRAEQLTVSWNCRNLRMLLNTERPHNTVLTIEEKLSSRMMMSEASLATSVPGEMGRLVRRLVRRLATSVPGAIRRSVSRSRRANEGSTHQMEEMNPDNIIQQRIATLSLAHPHMHLGHLSHTPAMPMARPTSDSRSAGASFVPSPVTATTSPSSFSSLTRVSLSSGDERASTLRRGSRSCKQQQAKGLLGRGTTATI